MKSIQPSISVVITARNEAKTIASVLEETIAVVKNLTRKFEIIINNDASDDKTTEILKKFAEKYQFIKAYHQKKPLGIAGAFEFLYRKAQYNLVFTNAGDGEYSSQELPKMLKKLNQGADVVVGKRENKHYGWTRKIISFFFNSLPKIIFKVSLYDAGSIKLYKKKVLEKTQPQSKGVFNEAERLIRASGLGYKIGAVNIKHYSRKGGKASGVKISLIIEALMDLNRLFYSLKFKKHLLKE